MDTNAVIDFLGGLLPENGEIWMEKVTEERTHALSVINQIELLGFNGVPEEMEILTLFINTSRKLPLDDKVAQATIEIRKKHKIKLPDAVIAATALTYDLIVITRNTKDFEAIEGLECINPHGL